MRLALAAAALAGLLLAACAPVTPAGPAATATPIPVTPAATATATQPPAAAAVTTPVPAATAVAANPLRQVDWAAWFRTNPALRTDLPPMPGGTPDMVPVDLGRGDAGYALTRDVAYANLSGRPGDLYAIVPVFSGGTAGNIAAMVLALDAQGQPRLVGVIPGYKLDAEVRGDTLLIRQVAGAGWEPNCCWSGIEEAVWEIDPAGRLVSTSSREYGTPEARPLTITTFYDLIGAGRFQEAWAFLSPAEQVRQGGFDRWRTGFAQTVSVEAEVPDVANSVQAVPLTLTVVDRAADGSRTTRRFQGTWTLYYSVDRHQWLLDGAMIRQVSP